MYFASLASPASPFNLPREDENLLLSDDSQHQSNGPVGMGWRNYVRPVSLRVLARQCLVFMRPSFLGKGQQPEGGSEKAPGPAPPVKKNSTEYLDGVRGVASLIVFNLHWGHLTFPELNSSWGYKDNTSWWLLPFVRLIFSGAAMVSVFFVVSGFVLSHRYIQRMHQFDHDSLYASLTSITFRRFIRLFLPAFVSSLMAYVCACFGMYEIPDSISGEPFEHGLGAYFGFLDMESDPWTWDLNFTGFYNPQLWSIAVEFRGSMIIFLLIVGLARSRTAVRLAVEFLLAAHSFGFGHKRWDVGLFVVGMIIAELEVLLRNRMPRSPARRRVLNAILVLVLLGGVFLSGYPRDGNTKTPGYMWSATTWPFTAYRRRFWLAMGAILIVGPMVFLPAVQQVFLTRPARYLGRISFALYLVHGLGNKTVGEWLMGACAAVFGGAEGEAAPRALTFVVATVLYFPFVIWVSDMFWRGVDVPSTEFARWLEKKCAARETARL